MNPDPPASDSFLRIDAAAAADGNGLALAPVSVLLRVAADPSGPGALTGAVLAAIGSPSEVDRHPNAAGAVHQTRPASLLIPGLVNAHAHLDLTHIGPRAFRRDLGFSGFVETVRTGRCTEDGSIAASVRRGADMSAAGGVVAVGDIAGAPLGRPCLAPLAAMRATSLAGTSFLEFFAIGTGEERARRAVSEAVAHAEADSRVHFGLQPHAPTTVALSMYRWALMEYGREFRFSTHLAETPEEHEFIARAGGPQREFLEILGLWDDRMLEEIGHGRTPVEHMATVLAEAPFLCAHANDCSDGDLAILERTPTSVAYCPRASDYFGAHEHFGPHRYRDMLAAGINVCLGTDSIINLPPGTDRLSPLDEARFVYQRDRTDPVTLLRMATINGAKALGLNERHFAFNIGSKLAGVLAVPFTATPGLTPLAAALSCDSLPEHVLFGK